MLPNTSPTRVLTARVREFCRDQGLIRKGDTLLVAVSGGLDSVALLATLLEFQKAWRLSLVVAHVNYHLRGQESDGDAQFVRKLAEQYSLPHEEHRVPSGTFGKGNIQDRARRIRYEFFQRLSKKYAAAAVAVAHHGTDQAETLLMRLVRGSGVTGLAGIRSSSEIYGVCVIRPFLCLSREDIEKIAKAYGLKHREDSSNAGDKYLRNKIRHSLLPLLTHLNPRWIEQAGHLATLFQEEEDLWGDLIEELFRELVTVQGKCMTVKRLLFNDLPRPIRLRLLRRMSKAASLKGGLMTHHHVLKMDTLATQKSSARDYSLPGKLKFSRSLDLITLQGP